MKALSADVQTALYEVNLNDLVHLFTFEFSEAWGGTKRWNSSGADVTFDGTTWTRGPVIVGHPRVDNRSGLEVGALDVELDPGTIELVTGKNLKVAALDGAFDGIRVLYQLGVFSGDTCVGVMTEFDGRVNRPLPGSTTIRLAVRCVRSRLEEPIPKRGIQAQCPYRFGDPATCKSVATGPCNKSLERCTALGNIARFGGFPFVPSEEAR